LERLMCIQLVIIDPFAGPLRRLLAPFVVAGPDRQIVGAGAADPPVIRPLNPSIRLRISGEFGRTPRLSTVAADFDLLHTVLTRPRGAAHAETPAHEN